MKKWGDRRDATLCRDVDGMHYVFPLMYPNRTDNEAYITVDVELEELEAFLKKLNEGKSEEEQFSLFGAIITASLRTVYLRPKMNRFYVNKRLYQRNGISAAFVVKKDMKDDGAETLARIEADKSDNLVSIQKKVNDQIRFCKTQNDQSTDSMEFIKHLPFKKLIGVLARWADRHDLMPKSVIATDPTQCTLFLTNLGSIGLNIGYHHLANWGTNSIFMVVGKKVNKAHYDRSGKITMKRVVKISFTVDERISDGFYCSKSIRMMKRFLEKPELLLERFDVNEEE